MLLLLAALALFPRVHDFPIVRFAGLFYADAPATLFIILFAATGIVESLDQPPHPWRLVGAVLALASALLSADWVVLVVGFAGAALLRLDGWRSVAHRLLPVVALGGATMLFWRTTGVTRLHLPAAGVGLQSQFFALVVLSTLIGSGVWRLAVPVPKTGSTCADLLLPLAWCYPLIRLYSLGPWNVGWLLALQLLGGGIVLLSGARALGNQSELYWLIALQYMGLVLVGIGLGSGAGLVAAFAALFTLPLVTWGLAPNRGESTRSGPAQTVGRWLLSAAIPLSAPFVVAWMSIGAAFASGSGLLAGILWLALLAGTLALLRSSVPLYPWRSNSAGIVSILLGIGSPFLVQPALQPAIKQLQGGLTSLGEHDLWPWSDLSALNAAKHTVITIPSVALIALLLILAALAWLLARWEYGKVLGNR